MPDAYVIGAGQSPFGSSPEQTYLSLFETAYDRALESIDGPFDPARIDMAVLGTLGVGGRQIGLSGPAVTEAIGLPGLSTTRVENACASSGYAFHDAVRAVRSGSVEVALAGGYEVMTDTGADQTRWWLGVSGETAWERMAGTTFAGVYAQMASAHRAEYGTTAEDLARVAVKNHENGAENPHSHLGFTCTLEDVLTAPVVAAPLNLYHCCPVSDGASAVLVASETAADALGAVPVRVAGTATASGRIGLFQRSSLTSIPASRQAAERAYADAGIEPMDLDFAEVHDCFAIAELVAYEDLGFCAPGEAGELLRGGSLTRMGSCLSTRVAGSSRRAIPSGRRARDRLSKRSINSVVTPPFRWPRRATG